MKNQSNDIEITKDRIRNTIRWEMNDPNKLGGQSCGIIYQSPSLICDELDIKIQFGYYRSTLKNKEMAMDLFESALDQIIN